jgi:hypothetical protein
MIDPRLSDEDLYDLLQEAIESGNTEAQAEIEAELGWREGRDAAPVGRAPIGS